MEVFPIGFAADPRPVSGPPDAARGRVARWPVLPALLLAAACGGDAGPGRSWPATDVYADDYLLRVVAEGGPVYTVRRTAPGTIFDPTSYRRAQIHAVEALSGCRVVDGRPLAPGDGLRAFVSCP